jgi:phosphoesterase RecJ-like protein
MHIVQQLKKIIESSDKILVTSHISPDPDSICSILLTGTSLQANFPDKQITIFSEELAEGLEFLDGYSEIQSGDLGDAINRIAPDLIILVDAMNYTRATRGDVHELLNKNMDLVILDHHPEVGVAPNKLYINDGYPAAVQQVYETFFHELNFEKPQTYAQTTMAGLYSDTGGFAYLNNQYKKTLVLVAELLETGIKIEKIRHLLHRYSKDHLIVLAELSKNISVFNDCTYSFLTDEFVDEWKKQGKSVTVMRTGTKIFTDDFIRNIDGRVWGFLVYPDPIEGEGCYSVSLRSVAGVVDVSVVAAKLNGGGHVSASGARLKAQNINEAIEKIKEAINQTR